MKVIDRFFTRPIASLALGVLVTLFSWVMTGFPGGEFTAAGVSFVFQFFGVTFLTRSLHKRRWVWMFVAGWGLVGGALLGFYTLISVILMEEKGWYITLLLGEILYSVGIIRTLRGILSSAGRVRMRRQLR